jgi:hypothetical protein
MEAAEANRKVPNAATSDPADVAVEVEGAELAELRGPDAEFGHQLVGHDGRGDSVVKGCEVKCRAETPDEPGKRRRRVVFLIHGPVHSGAPSF